MFLFIPVPFSVSTLIQILQHLMFVWHLIRVSLQFSFGLRCFPCPIQLNYLTFNCFLISSGFVIHNCHLAQLRWRRHVNNVINFQWLCKITHVTMKKKKQGKVYHYNSNFRDSEQGFFLSFFKRFYQKYSFLLWQFTSR